jgi:hypothetical protein
MTCESLVRGSIYSKAGGNRYDDCPHPAKYRVTLRDGTKRLVCGTHARGFKLFNERHMETGKILGLEREPFYGIEELK